MKRRLRLQFAGCFKMAIEHPLEQGLSAEYHGFTPDDREVALIATVCQMLEENLLTIFIELRLCSNPGWISEAETRKQVCQKLSWSRRTQYVLARVRRMLNEVGTKK